MRIHISTSLHSRLFAHHLVGKISIILYFFLCVVQEANAQAPKITSFTPTSGTIGTTVTITGTNFNATPANNAVYFGAIKATPTAGSTTSLTVTVPAGATSVTPIVVQNTATGLQASSMQTIVGTIARQFTVTNSPTLIPSYSRKDYATGSTPTSVAVGDFNGDGKPDLATANAQNGGNSISVLLGDGLGGFGVANTFTAGTQPDYVVSGDFNGDGKADLAVANNQTHNVSILIGNGLGSFSAPTNFAVGINPWTIALGDFNGDGKTDLAVANFNSANVSILIGNGLGGFGTATNFSMGTQPQAVAVGDFNGDGKADIASANYGSNNVSVRIGNGLGGFGAVTNFAMGTNPSSVSLGDFNGDGRIDLATANGGGGNISVRLGNGSGSFGAITNFVVGAVPFTVVSGDFNGDDKTDLATAIYSGCDCMSILLGNGTGSFGTATQFATGNSPYSLTVGDFNKDGRADIVVPNSGNNNVSIFSHAFLPTITSFTPTSGTIGTTITITGTNFHATPANNAVYFGAIKATPTAGSTTSLTVTVPAGATSIAPIVVQDITTGLQASSMQTVAGTTTRQFTVTNSPVVTPNYAKTDFGVGTNPYSITVGDFDADGKIDLASANYGANTLSILSGNGIGGMTANAIASYGTSPISIEKGDINRDGIMDWVVANAGSNTLSLLLGNGAGSATLMSSYSVGNTPRSVAVGDFNKDGYMDAVSANAGSNNVSILLNNGAGIFVSAVQFTTGTYPVSIATADFNGDKNLDVVVANMNSNNISILLGSGSGGFGTATNFAVGTNPHSVAVGDFNGDGRVDLAVSNYGSNNTSVLIGNGAGSFGTATNFATGTAPISVVVGDFNGDGKADIATANYNSNNASILLGTGSGSFGVATNFVVGTNPRFITSGDFNGDGKADLATANENSNNTSVLLQTSPPSITSFMPTSGTIGTTVTITGTNFNATPANNAVYFGAIKATPTAGSTTSLTVTVPAGATSIAPIVVQNTITGLQASSMQTIVGTITRQFTVTNSPTLIPNYARTDFAVGTQPISVATGDFNGDGKTDMATANKGGNAVSILLGNGAGSFGTATNFAVGTEPASVSVGDFNGDGKQDLAVANYLSNNVSILIGNGLGSFGTATNFSGFSGPRSLTVGDFNGDGKADLASVNWNSTNIGVLIGNGLGSFGTVTNFSVAPPWDPMSPWAITSSDFNGDGKLDLAVLYPNHNLIGILIGNGLGGFAFPNYFYIGEFGSNPQAITTGDFNQDGKIDLVIANRNSQNIGILFGQGNGFFGSPVSFPVGNLPNSLAIGDCNGDGKTDIAVGNEGSNDVSILIGNGLGSFDTHTNFAVATVPRSVAVGDFNGDGKADIVTANTSNSISVLLYTPSVTPSIPMSLASFSPTSGITSSTVTLTGTGFNATPTNNIVYFGAVKATVTSATTTSLTVTVPAGAGSIVPISISNTSNSLSASSSGSTTPFFTVTSGSAYTPYFRLETYTNPSAGGLADLAVGDFTGDGKADIVGVDPNTGFLTVYLNNGAGKFNTFVNTTLGSLNGNGIAITDFNGDSKLDLLIAQYGRVGVKILLGNGSGGFNVQPDVGVGVDHNGIQIADFNKDGKMDIATGTNEGLRVMFGNGSGGVTSFYNMASVGNVKKVLKGDFNKDGIVDLLMWNGTAISFAKGKIEGYFTFEPVVNLATTNNIWDWGVGDFNQDNTLDFWYFNPADTQVKVFLGNGLGAFSNVATPGLNVNVFPDKEIADFNGDGKADTWCRTGLYVGNGNGTFSSLAPQTWFANELEVGDFNEDGKADLVVGGWNGSDTNPVTVLLADTKRVYATKDTLSGFSASIHAKSDSKTVSVGLTFNTISASSFVTATPSNTDWEVSIDNINFSASVNTPVISASNTTSLYVRLKSGLTLGTKNATIILSASGYANSAITLEGTVAEYAYIPDVGKVKVVNMTTHEVVREITGLANVTNVAVSPDASKIYVASSSNLLYVISGVANAVSTTVNLSSSPSSMVFNPNGNELYVLKGFTQGYCVVNTNTNAITNNIPPVSGESFWNIEVHPNGSKLYLSGGTGSVYKIYVYNTSIHTLTKTISLANPIDDMSVSPNGLYMYGASTTTAKVGVINLVSDVVHTWINVSNSPRCLAVNSNNSKVYVTHSALPPYIISTINTVTNTVVNTFNVGNEPYGLAVSPDGNKLIVLNTDQNTNPNPNPNAWIIDTSNSTNLATLATGYQGVNAGNMMRLTYNPAKVGLIAKYPFTGNSNDVSGNNYHGVANGVVLTTDRFDDANSAYSFDGINDEINLNHTFGDYTDLTVSAWVYQTNSTGMQGIVSSNTTESFHFQTNTSGNVVAYQTNESTGFAVSLPIIQPVLGQWRHLVVKFSSGASKIYENGVAISNVSDAYSFIVASNLLKIGSGFNNSRFFAGKIDDINIEHRALSDVEILALYNEGRPALPTNLTVGSAVCGVGIVLNWTDASNNEKGFEVWRSTTIGSGYVLIATTPSNIVTYTDNNSLTVGTTYYYKIRAKRGEIFSAYTSTVNTTLIDTTPPTINAITNKNATILTGCSAVVNGLTPTATDVCSVVTITYTLSGATIGNGSNDASGVSFNRGTTTVTYTAKDASDNTATTSFNVAVTDAILPTITVPTNKVANVTAGTCSAIVTGLSAIATDNCTVTSVKYVLSGATTFSSPTTGIQDASSATFAKGITQVLYTATDIAGNSAQASFTVTVIDNIKPTLVLPTDKVVSTSVGACTATVTGLAPTTATDNCDTPVVTYILTGATTGGGNNNASGVVFNKGLTTLTYTATDASGNTESKSITITVNDTEKPTITTPNPISVNANVGSCTALVSLSLPTVTDNCTAVALISVNYNLTGATVLASQTGYLNSYTFNKGITQVNYTAIDASGNSETKNFTVTVLDNIAPTLTLPNNQTINLVSGCSIVVNGIDAVAVDNCEPTVMLTYTLSGATTLAITNGQASGKTFNKGTTTVTYMAKDSQNNSVSDSFTVTVVDAIKPTLTLPADKVVSTSIGNCTATVIGLAPLVATDNCDTPIITYTLTGATTGSGNNNASGIIFNKGTTTLGYTTIDASGNTETKNMTITVNDTEQPVINTPNAVSVNADVGACSASVNIASPTITDNCTVISSTSYTLTGATILSSQTGYLNSYTFNKGVTQVNYTAIDADGNTKTASFNVTILDNIAPTLTVPNNQTINLVAGCSITVNNIDALAVDNCDATATLAYTFSGATTLAITNGQASGKTFNKGTTTVTYTAKDSQNNSVSKSFTVTVIDAIPPILVLPADKIVNTATGGCTTSVLNIAPITATDNCGVPTITYILTGATTGNGNNNASGVIFNRGVTTLTYKATDASGVSVEVAMSVTVIDAELPTIGLPNTSLSFDTAPNSCKATNVTIVPNTSDNCTINKLVYTLSGATNFNSPNTGINVITSKDFEQGTTLVTYIVTDESGNNKIATATVTVSDNQKPQLSAPSNIVVDSNTTDCKAIVTGVGVVATDNCGFVNVAYTLTGATNGIGVTDASGTMFNKGVTTVVYTATDGNGNTEEKSFTVLVKDNAPPQIATPENKVISTNTNLCVATINNIGVNISDNCSPNNALNVVYVLSGATVGSGTNDASGQNFQLGLTNVLYTATDEAGNTKQAGFTILVQDTEKPVLTLPTIEVCDLAEANTYASFAQAQSVGATASDNCTLEPNTFAYVSQNYESGVYPEIFKRIYKISDKAGNIQETAQTIKVYKPKPNFIFSTKRGKSPLNVTIINQTIAPTPQESTLYWDFGNGQIYTGHTDIPKQIYKNITDDEIFYVVSLRTVSNRNCEVIKRDTIWVPALDCSEKIEIPNAFTPTISAGLNDTYRPVIRTGVDGYKFQIIDRLGGIIFETTDTKQGWDGRINGNLAHAGKYIFKIFMKCDKNRGETTKQGGFTLIR